MKKKKIKAKSRTGTRSKKVVRKKAESTSKNRNVHRKIKKVVDSWKKTSTRKKKKIAKKTVARVRINAKAPKIKELKLKPTAAAIHTYLAECGFDPVLIGPACSAIYGGVTVKTASIDFVVSEYVIPKMKLAMKKLGFSRSVHRTFRGPSMQFDVSFHPPPLAVGDDIVHEINIMKTKDGSLKLLTPTDCVRQRLSAYYRFGDKDALEQAVAVAIRQEHKIDFHLVERWSDWEWASDRFEEFRKMFDERKNL